MRDLEKQKEEVRAALEQREQDAVDQVKVIVDALDERAKVLHEDKQTREQLHSISDSVLFLQVQTPPFRSSVPSLKSSSLAGSHSLSTHACLTHLSTSHPFIHTSVPCLPIHYLSATHPPTVNPSIYLPIHYPSTSFSSTHYPPINPPTHYSYAHYAFLHSSLHPHIQYPYAHYSST